jgi:hypothetical protein
MYDPLDVAAVYSATFMPRQDAYAVPMWRDGKVNGWRPVRDEQNQNVAVTPEVVLAALTKIGPPLSGYLITAENMTHVWAFDLDLDDGFEQAMVLGRYIASQQMPCYVERSRRGAHLWGVMESALSARTVRRAMRYWVERAGLPTDEPKIELRPGQDEIPAGGLGTPLRLPTMPHPATGKRYLFIDPVSGKPLGANLAEMLLAMDLGAAKTVAEAARLYQPLIDPKNLHGYSTMPHRPYPEDDRSISEMLAAAGVQNARPGHAVKCLWHPDKVASLSILRDDERVLCRGGGCPLGGNGMGTIQLERFLAQGGTT